MRKIAKRLIFSRLNSKLKKLLASKDITIIGVTGSVGKTSTKFAIGEVLSSTRKVRYSTVTTNTDIEVMLSFFGINIPARGWSALSWKKVFSDIDDELENYRFDTVIIEFADDKLSSMRKILKTVKLDYGVISGIAPVHMAKMYDMRSIIYANWAIVSSANKIIFNSDITALRKKAYKDRTTGFGLHHGDIRFNKISRNRSGYLKAELSMGRNKKMVQTRVIGEQNLYSLLAAAAIAGDMDIPFSAICFELENIKSLPGRMNLLKGVNGSKLIDDSYDSSPTTVMSGLDTLKKFPGRKIAVIGSMDGLGSERSSLHQEVGEHCFGIIDVLVTVGTLAEDFIAPSAVRAGIKNENVKMFKTPYEAGHYLKGIIRKSDTILLEGDKNISFVEEVARIILSPEISSETSLIRQDKQWKRKKRNILKSL